MGFVRFGGMWLEFDWEGDDESDMLDVVDVGGMQARAF